MATRIPLLIKLVSALVYLSSDIPGYTLSHEIPWQAASVNETIDPGDGGPVQRFWLGANFTFATTDVNTTTNVITKTAHGFVNGEGPTIFTSSTTLPGGMAIHQKEWIGVVDVDHFKLYPTRADALAGTNARDLTTQGTGTHTCARGGYLVVPKSVNKVRVTGNVRVETDLADYLLAVVGKNFATAYGLPEEWTYDYAVNLASGDFVVTEGDMLSINEEGGGADDHTIDADEKATWMAITAIGRE